MFTVQEELFKDVYEEAKPLLEAHWVELALHQDVRPLDADEERYRQLNDLGVLRIITIRRDTKLIGYASFLINTGLHYKTWKNAVCDIYYLDPSLRKEGLGLKFFQEILKWLKAYEVKSIVVQDKLHKSHKDFFLTMGFEAIEQTYEMII